MFVPLRVKAGTRILLERYNDDGACFGGEWGLTIQCAFYRSDPSTKYSGAVMVVRDDQLTGASESAKALGVSLSDAQLI